MKIAMSDDTTTVIILDPREAAYLLVALETVWKSPPAKRLDPMTQAWKIAKGISEKLRSY